MLAPDVDLWVRFEAVAAQLTRSQALLRPLGETPLFTEFSPDELSVLAGTARLRVFREGETIFHRDDPGNGLYVIRQGTIKISVVAPDGQETLVNLLGSGECFGEMAVLDGQPRSATATAMARSELLFLPRDGFLRFLDEHPVAMRKIISVLSRWLRHATDHVADIVFYDVHGRVAKKLLELAETYGRPDETGGVDITLPLTQQELANLVGASRESVNKVLKLYRDKGYLATGSQRIKLLRPDMLRRRVELG